MWLAATWGTGEVLWSTFWFFMFVIWMLVLFMVFADIFRSTDMSGWTKALWVIFVVVFPWLGVLIYIVVRGATMPGRYQRPQDSPGGQ